MNLKVTVLTPTKNEEITIEQFINWVYAGFKNLGVNGEIILADSPMDRKVELA
jgi:hypothetical protein